MPVNPRTLANLPVKLTRMNPPKGTGWGHGGGGLTPCPKEGCHGAMRARVRQLSAMGYGASLTTKREALTMPLLCPLLGRLLPIFTDFSDFLGRLHPSTTTIQKPLDTLGVEESS